MFNVFVTLARLKGESGLKSACSAPAVLEDLGHSLSELGRVASPELIAGL